MFSAYLSLHQGSFSPDTSIQFNAQELEEIEHNIYSRGLAAPYFMRNVLDCGIHHIKGNEARFFISYDSFFVIMKHEEDDLVKVTEFLCDMKSERDAADTTEITRSDFVSQCHRIEEATKDDSEDFFIALFDFHCSNIVVDAANTDNEE